MMKKLLILLPICMLAFFACGTKDNKNEVTPYPTYDTNSTMENKNNSIGSDSTAMDNENR